MGDARLIGVRAADRYGESRRTEQKGIRKNSRETVFPGGKAEHSERYREAEEWTFFGGIAKS